MTEHDSLTIVGPTNRFPKVSLLEPVESGYLLLALEVDRRPPVGFFVQSRQKKRLIRELKDLVRELQEKSEVLDATVFKAMIIPPGRGALLKDRPQVEVARFDVVLLVEFTSVKAAEDFIATDRWTTTLESVGRAARKTLSIAASNVRRIGPVDHSRDGVFLFNYFYADDVEINLDVWKYTAGWFQDQTGLDNSTVLLPTTSLPSCTIINHCRWDRRRDILPALVFNRSFRPFVLANFEANATAAVPILYRLA